MTHFVTTGRKRWSNSTGNCSISSRTAAAIRNCAASWRFSQTWKFNNTSFTEQSQTSRQSITIITISNSRFVSRALEERSTDAVLAGLIRLEGPWESTWRVKIPNVFACQVVRSENLRDSSFRVANWYSVPAAYLAGGLRPPLAHALVPLPEPASPPLPHPSTHETAWPPRGNHRHCTILITSIH